MYVITYTQAGNFSAPRRGYDRRALLDARAAYDQWHTDHPTGSGAWYDLARKVLDGRLEGATVLEIGCGGGGFAAWMAAMGARSVSGEDFSDTAIETACNPHTAANLAFRLGDIQRIEHPDDTFDVVVSCETLEHLPAPYKAVTELARVLRPGGLLVLSTPNYPNITGAHRVFREATGRHWDEEGQPIVRWTMIPRTLWWLRRAGLSIRSLQGTGWYIPVPRRPGGYAWEPPHTVRPLFEPFALHQVIEARKVEARR